MWNYFGKNLTVNGYLELFWKKSDKKDFTSKSAEKYLHENSATPCIMAGKIFSRVCETILEENLQKNWQ